MIGGRFDPAPEDAEGLALLDAHWALGAVEPAVRARALDAATRWWATASDAPAPDAASLADDALDGALAAVGTLATAYDLAALEHLDALVRAPLPGTTPPLARRAALRTGAARAFQLHAPLPAPLGDAHAATAFRLLHLAATAVVGDRADDFARWLAAAGGPTGLGLGSDAAPPRPWDAVVREQLALAWLALLFARGDREAHDRARALLAMIREGREAGETALFARDDASAVAAARFRLFALYHLADAAEALTTYLARGEPADVRRTLAPHFTLARAGAAGDPRAGIAIGWLHAAAVVVADGRAEQLSLPGLTQRDR